MGDADGEASVLSHVRPPDPKRVPLRVVQFEETDGYRTAPGPCYQAAGVAEMEHPPLKFPVQAAELLFRPTGRSGALARRFVLVAPAFSMVTADTMGDTLKPDKRGRRAATVRGGQSGEFLVSWLDLQGRPTAFHSTEERESTAALVADEACTCDGTRALPPYSATLENPAGTVAQRWCGTPPPHQPEQPDRDGKGGTEKPGCPMGSGRWEEVA